MICIPFKQLSSTALANLIEEFVARDSTVDDGTLQQKREQVMQALKAGKAVITFDSTTESTSIALSEDVRRAGFEPLT